MEHHQELAAWLGLAHTPGLGRAAARRLLARAGSAQAALEHVTACSQTDSEAQQARLLSTWQWLQQAPEGLAHAVITLADARYPQSLLETADPPLLLYVVGAQRFFSTQSTLFPAQRALAIVGCRNPSAQGAMDAQAFAQMLCAAGLCIVSGMALGIDAAAHLGALEAAQAGLYDTAAAATIAVMGTGIDQVYPRSHCALAQRIARAGLLVSEYPLGAPPLAAHFPQRNRIIAGLAQGTLVVEAALASGSLITARLAAEQGREVFALPGSIHSARSRGCHALLREGAKLVETAQDVLDELQGLTERAAAPVNSPEKAPANAAQTQLLSALGFDPLGLDALVARTGWDAAHLQVLLLELELAGRVVRLPGGLFQRVQRC